MTSDFVFLFSFFLGGKTDDLPPSLASHRQPLSMGGTFRRDVPFLNGILWAMGRAGHWQRALDQGLRLLRDAQLRPSTATGCINWLDINGYDVTMDDNQYSKEL